MEIFEKMAYTGVSRDLISFNAVISACAKGQYFDKAMEFHAEMKAINIKSDEITYNSLISACERNGKWESAIDLVSEMEMSGIFPTEHTFTALIQVLVSSNRFDEAFSILARVHRNEDMVKSTYAMHQLLFNACQNIGDDRAEEVYLAIKKFGIQPLPAEVTCYIHGREAK